jgi:hypothetical protein
MYRKRNTYDQVKYVLYEMKCGGWVLTIGENENKASGRRTGIMITH